MRLAAALMAIRPREFALPRIIEFSEHPWVKRGHAKTLAGGRDISLRSLLPRLIRPALAVVMLVVMLGLALHFTGADPGYALAFPTLTGKPAQLQTLLTELKAAQEKYAGKEIPQAEGEALEAKAKEAEALQAEIDKELKNTQRIEGIERTLARAAEIPEPVLPKGSKGTDEQEVVGYLSLGSAFVRSPEFKQFLEAGMPREAGSAPVRVKSIAGGREQFIPLDRKALAALRESKAVATIGADVIQPDRIADVVRDTEMELLTIRSLLNVQPTDSNSIEYVTFTPAAAPAAAPVAESAVKPETTMTLGTATAPVRTLAVHMPVTEQQLQDLPQVQGIIDTELRYEIAFVEDEQVTWGDGVGQNLLGIFNTPGVIAGRTVGGDTLLDKIRRAITDVRVARNAPNGLAVHPYDMEALQLLKGTDNTYVWVIVTDAATGQMRVWGLQAVESLGMEKPEVATTPERRVLVGDFIRGATLWDRMQAAVAVGYVNDQFIRNQRTIRAEERVAFGVKRPKAFRYIVAQATVV